MDTWNSELFPENIFRLAYREKLDKYAKLMLKEDDYSAIRKFARLKLILKGETT